MRFLLSIIILVAATNLYSQKDTISTHPIDSLLESCLESDPFSSTAGMLKCINSATSLWDDELNKNYKLLMAVLRPDEKEKLKTSQLKWIEFRDKEFEFSDAAYNNLERTMWLVVKANKRLQIVKHRAIELMDYYYDIKSDIETYKE
jgi:uncharacterized protein YecT (DUF1311 family)